MGKTENGDRRLLPRHDITNGVCPRCYSRRVLGPDSWNGKRPKCPECGRALVRAPETRTGEFGPKQRTRKRRCRICGVPLSGYNHGEICFPCFEKVQMSFSV